MKLYAQIPNEKANVKVITFYYIDIENEENYYKALKIDFALIGCF